MKYSILIPTYNPGKYIDGCLQSIISQSYSDVEIIISDDSSTDGTREYLSTVNDPRVSVIYPPESMSMSEHWNWLLSRAHGEWIIFVGQDDGLQAYFFELADFLVQEAQQKNLRAIASERAYYFWPGCQEVYGDTGINAFAMPKIETRSTLIGALKALSSLIDYHALPQMYTTSLFHRSLIEEAQKLQEGKLIITHPQDANLAAIVCILEKEYLFSYTPLGWVGTSPKSAGLAISHNSSPELRAIYLDKIQKSKLLCHPLAGDFRLASGPLYFWGALLQGRTLYKYRTFNYATSPFIKYIVISTVLNDISTKRNDPEIINLWKELVKINNCNTFILKITSTFIRFLIYTHSRVQQIMRNFFIQKGKAYLLMKNINTCGSIRQESVLFKEQLLSHLNMRPLGILGKAFGSSQNV